MRKLFNLLLCSVVCMSALYGQQDCISPYRVCSSTTPIQSNVLPGSGNVHELVSNAYCFSNLNNVNAENNSRWFTFTTTTAGTLAFDIDPTSSVDDYDFMLFNITTGGCQSIVDGDLAPLRCNFSASMGGTTGLRTGYLDTTAEQGGDSFLAPVPVQVGETFALLVNNYTNNGQGFELSFANSTVSFDPTEPCGVTVGINDIEAIEQLNVFPNPATGGRFAISGRLQSSTQLEFTVYSTSGQILYSNSAVDNGPFTQPIDLPNLRPGLYIIQVKANNTSQLLKLIVSR